MALINVHLKLTELLVPATTSSGNGFQPSNASNTITDWLFPGRKAVFGSQEPFKVIFQKGYFEELSLLELTRCNILRNISLNISIIKAYKDDFVGWQ